MNKLSSIIPKYNKRQLKNFQSENQYMEAVVELLKQSIELIYLIVDERYCYGEEGLPKSINRDEAILAGNLTRLIKLNTSLLENICNRKTEISQIVLRCIAETYINIAFMLNSSDDRVFMNYIKYSLITEKELWNKIIENIKERNGAVQDIELRMQKSIQTSFIDSDFEFDKVNRSSKWKSISERARMVSGEQFYKVYYGIASHSIHDNWQDILFNHLTPEGKEFKINLEWNKPRPQIVDGAIAMNLDLVKLFVAKEKINKQGDYQETVTLLQSYHNELMKSHENHMHNEEKTD